MTPGLALPAWIGPGAEMALSEREARDRGAARPLQDRADAAIARAVTDTDAELRFCLPTWTPSSRRTESAEYCEGLPELPGKAAEIPAQNLMMRSAEDSDPYFDHHATRPGDGRNGRGGGSEVRLRAMKSLVKPREVALP